MNGENAGDRASARLSVAEAMRVIESGHTGVVATIRRDGTPVMTPVWFVVDDAEICFRTRASSKKVARLQIDQRCSFLVETGTRWSELCAAHVQGRASILSQSHPRFPSVQDKLDEKYRQHRTLAGDMPERTRAVYQKPPAIVALTVDRIIGWDNGLYA